MYKTVSLYMKYRRMHSTASDPSQAVYNFSCINVCKRPDDGLQLQPKHVAVNNWWVTDAILILAIC